MRKKLSITLVFTLILCLFQTTPAFASTLKSNENTNSSTIEYFEDGSYIVTELEQNINNGISPLSTSKTGTKTITYYSSSNEALCALKLTATFSYSGSTVSCTSTNCTKYSYDSAWSVEDVTTSHSNTSTTKASATANGTAVKRFLGIKIQSAALSTTIYCDKNGNLS